jgi:hypothetical protein
MPSGTGPGSGWHRAWVGMAPRATQVHRSGRVRMLSELKHAGPETLLRLESLLETLRQVPGLIEKKPGVFYRKSKAFLHFHEDPAGMHADVRLAGTEFERLRVETAKEQAALLTKIRTL